MSLGLPVHDHFADEGESSETLDRPAMQELINAVQEGLIERVIVYKVDRLIKPLAMLAELLAIFEQHEIKLLVVTDPNFGQSAASRLASNIVAAASEFQQDLTRDRLVEMRMALKRHGKRVAGQIPFGYMTEDGSSKLVPHPEHSVIIRDMFAMANAMTSSNLSSTRWRPLKVAIRTSWRVCEKFGNGSIRIRGGVCCHSC